MTAKSTKSTASKASKGTTPKRRYREVWNGQSWGKVDIDEVWNGAAYVKLPVGSVQEKPAGRSLGLSLSVKQSQVTDEDHDRYPYGGRSELLSVY